MSRTLEDLLRKTIDQSGARDRAARQVVYDRARAALTANLEANGVEGAKKTLELERLGAAISRLEMGYDILNPEPLAEEPSGGGQSGAAKTAEDAAAAARAGTDEAAAGEVAANPGSLWIMSEPAEDDRRGSGTGSGAPKVASQGQVKTGYAAIVPWIVHVWLSFMLMPVGAGIGVLIIEGVRLAFPSLPDWATVIGIVLAAMAMIGLIGDYWSFVARQKRLRKMLKAVPTLTGEFFPLGQLMQIPGYDIENDGPERHMLAVADGGLALLQGTGTTKKPYGRRLDGHYTGHFIRFDDILRLTTVVPDEEALNKAHRDGVVSDMMKNVALGFVGVRTRSSVVGAFVLVDVLADGEIGTYLFGIPADYPLEVVEAAAGSIKAHRETVLAKAINVADTAIGAEGTLEDLAEGTLDLGDDPFELQDLTGALGRLATVVSSDRAHAYGRVACNRLKELAGLA